MPLTLPAEPSDLHADNRGTQVESDVFEFQNYKGGGDAQNFYLIVRCVLNTCERFNISPEMSDDAIMTALLSHHRAQKEELDALNIGNVLEQSGIMAGWETFRENINPKWNILAQAKEALVSVQTIQEAVRMALTFNNGSKAFAFDFGNDGKIFHEMAGTATLWETPPYTPSVQQVIEAREFAKRLKVLWNLAKAVAEKTQRT